MGTRSPCAIIILQIFVLYDALLIQPPMFSLFYIDDAGNVMLADSPTFLFNLASIVFRLSSFKMHCTICIVIYDYDVF